MEEGVFYDFFEFVVNFFFGLGEMLVVLGYFEIGDGDIIVVGGFVRGILDGFVFFFMVFVFKDFDGFESVVYVGIFSNEFVVGGDKSFGFFFVDFVLGG